MVKTIRELSFAETWKEAFFLYARNFLPLFIIAVISILPSLPLVMGKTLDGIQLDKTTDIQTTMRIMAWLVFSFAMSNTASGVMTGLLYRKVKGEYKGIVTFLKEILPMLSAILVLSFAVAFAVGFGLMAFVIPGLYAALALSLAAQILVIEKKGIRESLKRSFDLTQGKKTEIFLYTIFLVIVNYALERVVTGAFSIFENIRLGIDPKVISLLLAQSLAAPLGACMYLLIYFNIRLQKEPGKTV